MWAASRPASAGRERAKASKGEGAAILAARQPQANRGRAAIQPRPSLDRAEPNRNKLVRTAPNRDRSVLALRSNRA
ncbi:protamine P1 [Burkholderia pseudomallei]|nr:protamine P1 [Burkholderia pseudomallei]